MPKIIIGNGKWKTVDVPGECINDDNFTCLSSIEEYIPIEEYKDISNMMVFFLFNLFLFFIKLYSIYYTIW